MLTQPPRKISTLALLDPDIPDSPETPLPSGERSINRAAVLGVFPDKGLQVRIHPWAVMGRGDKAELLVNNNVVAQHTLQNDAEVDQRVTMFVPSRNLLTGAHTLSYRITRLNQLPETQTPPLKLYVKLELPADQDLDPGPGHSNLSMYIDPKIIDGGVDKEVAEDGVLVIIRGPAGDDALYPGAAVGDIATLSWGGVFKNSEPLTAEQISNPVDNPFGVLVDKTIIDEAGDTDAAGLAVSYLLEDVVKNRAEDWCKETRIMVSTSTDLLIAPIIEQATNNVIDLEKLKDEDPVAQVWVTDKFKLGDIITATMRGTTTDGDPVEVDSDPQTVVNLPHIYELKIKNSAIRKLAKTQCVFFYHVARAGAPAPLRSKGQFVQVIGEGTPIDAPIAEDANQGILDPDLSSTTIRIPHNPYIEAGVAIEVSWFGTLFDQSSYNPELDWHFPSAAEANNPDGFTLTVDGQHLKILEGGTLRLSYVVLKDVNGEIVKRSSRTAAVLNVGEPKRELVHPLVEGEKDGALEPADLPDNRSKLTAPRPTTTPSKAKDVVTYTWDGEVTGKVEDSVTLNSLSANRDVIFNLDPEFVAKHIEPNRGNKVIVTYRILRAETSTTSYSNPLEFVVGVAQQELLDPARVIEAPDDVLDPADVPNGATVQMDANRQENAGDHFYMKWVTADNATVHEDDKPISSNNKGKPVEFTVPHRIVLTSLGQDVTISYHVELFEGGEALGKEYRLKVEAPSFELPVAVFKEATGAQEDQLNPDDVYPGGATVVIKASAHLKEDDQITVTVEGKTNTTYSHTVKLSEADKELSSIKVPYSVISANEGDAIALSYIVKRKTGGTDGPSTPTEYDVRKVIGSGHLKVLGARYNRSTYRASSASRVLSSFNATTGQALQAEWKYANQSDWTTASTWRDTEPQEPLQVRTTDDQCTLNPANIIGNGVDTEVAGNAAFVAHRDFGDVVGWGKAAYGASIPATIITMTDIVEVSCTRSAYAARRANSAVVVWGTAAEGGSMTGVTPLGFTQVVGNSTAFSGIKSDGKVVAWGTAADGGVIPADIAALTDIVGVTSAGQAFAAKRATGQVVAWGQAANGGEVPPEIGGLTDIEHVLGSFGAFAAHRANGRIIGWGHATYGGVVPANIAALTDIVELSCANAQAFTARRATGQVVAWGTAEYGGTVDPLIEGLTDIAKVVSTWRAFAALRANGHVVAWGRPAEGGLVPDDIATLDDIVQICGSSMAFAALRKNGTVVAWGDAKVGGDTSAVINELTQVQAVYDNTHGFTALTADGRVVTWGHPEGGGDSSAVQDRLKGKVSYLATPTSRGLARKARAGARLAVTSNIPT
ncbi:hypothetical protein N8H74_26550 [Pseudomonas sp. B2M1-30]|uniref:hypothetical protein n=1 Tax=Pseudomonas TaxID=286 RepID=UPI0021C5E7FA|nr:MULTISPECIES: hypothetical protein [Pseudomonas]MCU0121833.1 hypothetical protein [Pseudomonas sp. B2M1-30]MCU7264475.1 hypothetical protein [Pseudomonas koreensis]